MVLTMRKNWNFSIFKGWAINKKCISAQRKTGTYCSRIILSCKPILCSIRDIYTTFGALLETLVGFLSWFLRSFLSLVFQFLNSFFTWDSWNGFSMWKLQIQTYFPSITQKCTQSPNNRLHKSNLYPNKTPQFWPIQQWFQIETPLKRSQSRYLWKGKTLDFLMLRNVKCSWSRKWAISGQKIGGKESKFCRTWWTNARTSWTRKWKSQKSSSNLSLMSSSWTKSKVMNTSIS